MQTPNNLPSLEPRSNSLGTALPGALPSLGAVAVTRVKSRYAPVPPPRRMMASVIPMESEPEDAHLTGATRSLSRRLLALNIRQHS